MISTTVEPPKAITLEKALDDLERVLEAAAGAATTVDRYQRLTVMRLAVWDLRNKSSNGERKPRR